MLFGPEKYDAICDRIGYLISLKYGIAYVFSHNHARIKIDSENGLPLEKILTLHNAVILSRETPVFQSKQSMTK